MGEAFLGIPNRHKIVGTSVPDHILNSGNVEGLIIGDVLKRTLLKESTYNPTHSLSAHFGYLIANYYFPITGGEIKGNITAKNIFPANIDCTIGKSYSKYKSVYAETFYGNATSAEKLRSKITLKITGAVTGQVSFDGSEATSTINVVTNHNHDNLYLKKTGGNITGSIVFNTSDACITDRYSAPILSSLSTRITRVGKGPYDVKSGSLELYSYNILNVHSEYTDFYSKGSGTAETRHFRIVTNGRFSQLDKAVFLTNRRSDWAIVMKDDGKLLYRNHPDQTTGYKDYEIYHAGNTSGFLKTTASCNRNWNWSGLPGQPTWVWGGNDATNMYVYNPSNFNVAYAASASKSVFSNISNRVTSCGSWPTPTGTYYEATMTTKGNFIPYYAVNEYHPNSSVITGHSASIGLGSGSNPWDHIFASTGVVQTSDRNRKYDIENISKKYIELFMKLKPVSFKFKDSSSGEIHIGFIAQEVEDVMHELGLKNSDFAGLSKNIKTEAVYDEDHGVYNEIPIKNENGEYEYTYSLVYTEFIGLIIKQAQMLHREKQSMEDRLIILENKIKKLYELND